MADNAVLVFVIDSDPAKKGAQDVVNALTGVQKKSKETASSTQQMGKAMQGNVPVSQQLARSYRESATATQQLRVQSVAASSALLTLKQAVGGLSAAFAVRELVRYSDEYKKLSGRLLIVSKDTNNFLYLQRELNKVSGETRTGISNTTNLYARLAQTTTRTTATQRDLLEVTQAISKGLAITGEDANSAAGAITQFTQGLATNFEAAGQEIRSLQEQAPRVAKALAEGLNELGITANATSGDLMRLAKDGVITAENSIRALQTQMPKLNAEFAKIAPTVAQSFTLLNDALINFIGTNNVAIGVTDGIAGAITLLADNLDTLATAAGVAAAVFGTRLVIDIAKTTAAFVANQLQAAAAARMGVLYAAQQVQQTTAAYAVAASELAKARAFAASNLGVGTATGLAIANAEANLAQAVAARTSAGAMLTMNASVAAGAGVFTRIGTAISTFILGLNPLTIALTVLGGALFLATTRTTELDEIQQRHKNNMSKISEDYKTLTEASREQAEALRDESRANLRLAKTAIETSQKKIQALEAESRAITKAITRNPLMGARLGLAAADNPRAFDITEDLVNARHELANLKKEVEGYEKNLNKANAVIEKMGRKGGGGSGVPAVTGATEELKKELEKVNKELDKAKETVPEIAAQTSEVAQVFKDTATGIRDAFRDSFKALFSGEVTNFATFADKIKDVFTNMLAEMATLAIAKPIIVPIIQAVGAGIGLGETGINSVVGELGGAGSSSGGIGDLLGLGSMGGSGGFLSGIKDYVNSVASDVFGTFSGVGPQMPGVDNTFTGILGETFSGSWGGAIANLLGLGSGNMLLDTGTSLAGAAIGNLIFPGIGGIVGSFAGTALGGLFGGKSRPHPASNFGAKGFDAMGMLLDSVSSSKHTSTEVADALSKAVSDAVRGLAAGTGIDYSGINSFQGGVDDGRGFYSLGSFKDFKKGETFTFDPNKEGDAERALAETMLEMTRRVAGANGAIRADLIPALDRIKVEGREAADIIADIALIANFDNIGQQLYDTTQEATAMEAVMKQVDTQFNAVRTSATELGLPLSELENSLSNVKQYISTEFNARLDSALLAIKDPLQAQLNGLLDEYYNMSRDAIAANGDVSKVNELFSLKALQLQSQYDTVLQAQRQSITDIRSEAEALATSYASIGKSLGDALVALRLGDLSTLSPKDKLEEARARFLELSSKARSGDAAAAGELPAFANEFLKLSQSYFSSTGDFSADFELVQRELQAAQGYAASQEQLQRQLVVTSTQQLSALQTGFGDLTTILRNSNLTKVNSLANPNVLVSADNPNERVLALQGSLTQSQLAAAVEVLKATSPGVTPGQGTRSIFYEKNKAAAEQARAQLRNIIPGFASGTDYLRMGELAMVGERGPELMTSRYDSRVIPMEHSYMVLTAIERSNMIMEQSLREQEQQTLELRAQVVVLQDGMSRMLQQQGAIEQNTARAAQNATLQSRRKE